MELNSLEALERSRSVPSAFAANASALVGTPPKVLCYVRLGGRLGGRGDGSDPYRLRARMHRANGTEDAGTGSANLALIGLLASLPGGAAASSVVVHILQGVEMGRPSELRGDAERIGGGGAAGEAAVGAVRIGGFCALVSRGELVGWD